jgi:hypothetical protein
MKLKKNKNKPMYFFYTNSNVFHSSFLYIIQIKKNKNNKIKLHLISFKEQFPQLFL